jgi:hypothetical protein
VDSDGNKRDIDEEVDGNSAESTDDNNLVRSIVEIEVVQVPDSYVLSPSFMNLFHTIQVQKEWHSSI